MTTPRSVDNEQRLPVCALPHWRRAVLKVGSNLLAADGRGLTVRYAQALADFIASSHAQGRQVVLVSSGAVAAGRALMREHAPAGSDIAARQALAALGQAPMIALWQSLSARPVAQVLLTHDDLRNRRRYLNARATLRELLLLDVLPVVNENDTVAVDELKLGDNDNLAAIVAALVDADLLLIASDIDALYTADPRRESTAQPVGHVSALTPRILAMAGGSGSTAGTGGMRTKLEAAGKAAAAGIPTALFHGGHAATVQALTDGQLHGTLIDAASSRMQARKYWLRHAPAAPGRIRVDAGAALALGNGRASLLPGGIVDAEGEFQRGDMVEIIDNERRSIARGLCQYGVAEVRRLAGRHSREIEDRLGYSYGVEVVHRDDLVIIKAEPNS
ncbi:glutamate 5-kinase [Dyella tabacisoli]|uniref:Glutamate 5-kinase n=1 Tax=Dyella tabacisoli TaxID=2282381 RepID=A0A369UUC0_9GAMM|nr:glutamate 5-kinase [Dyella tabacisoli]RDD83635.1 glutamate 5-kinase [Dyella tabacisoli]